MNTIILIIDNHDMGLPRDVTLYLCSIRLGDVIMN